MNGKTIDGVPREQLVRWEELLRTPPGRQELLEELRAVLDAADHVHEWDINAEGTATVCHCGARSSDEPSTNPQDKASLLDPYDGGTFVESTPNGCENCAMDLSTCDCVEPKPVRWTYSPSRGSKSTPQGEPVAFQDRVKPWMLECFGEVIAADSQERNHRFLEEALELVQACGCTATEAHQLVEYVYGRPVGEPSQEVGGVMVTLAALCLAHGLDMHASGETELARIWTKVEQIRAKQAAKPAMSPLPGAYPDREQPAPLAEGTTSDKYRAELYDEVWQKARQLGFGNVTEALTFLEREVGEPHAYEYEFATVIYKDGPGKFKKVITNEAPDQHEIDAGCIINVKPLYAVERRKYDDTLLPFLAMMRKELHANSHKGDREGWLGIGREAAMSEIHWHSEKLRRAVNENDPEQIAEYTADVANCAMMLLDVCGGLGRA